jgi:hypothetical protein
MNGVGFFFSSLLRLFVPLFRRISGVKRIASWVLGLP